MISQLISKFKGSIIEHLIDVILDHVSLTEKGESLIRDKFGITPDQYSDVIKTVVKSAPEVLNRLVDNTRTSDQTLHSSDQINGWRGDIDLV